MKTVIRMHEKYLSKILRNLVKIKIGINSGGKLFEIANICINNFYVYFTRKLQHKLHLNTFLNYSLCN